MDCTLSKDLLPYEKVPLYRTIRDCLQHAYCIVVSIPKAYKFTIGSDSINSLRKTAESIFLAYEDGISIENKLTHLRNAKKYLHNTLIHPNKVHLFPANQTINFVGRIIKPFRSYPRRMVCEAVNKKFTDLTKNPLDKKLLNACNSYLGILKSTNTYKYRSKLCSKIDLPTIITPSVSKIKLIRI